MKLNFWEAPVWILSHHLTCVHNSFFSKSSLAFYFVYLGLSFFVVFVGLPGFVGIVLSSSLLTPPPPPRYCFCFSLSRKIAFMHLNKEKDK